jgi:hypothetical protein
VVSAGWISGFERNRISKRRRRDDLHRRDERLASIERGVWKSGPARVVRGMLTRPAKAVSFLASDERVTSLGQSSSLMAVLPKSDSSWADLTGCKAIALTVTPLTLCHRIDLPQQLHRCRGSLEFQIASRALISAAWGQWRHISAVWQNVCLRNL